MKSEMPKDWFLHVGTTSGQRKINAAANKFVAKTADELPELLTAHLYNSHTDCVRQLPQFSDATTTAQRSSIFRTTLGV